MLVYDAADPRVMSTGDLDAEHDYIHRLLDGECLASDREYIRFDKLGSRGRSLLILRHEWVRVGLALRHSIGSHGRESHPTPVDTDEATQRARALILWYERFALPLRTRRTSEDEVERYRPDIRESIVYYERLFNRARFPPPSHTPWKAGNMSLANYLTTYQKEILHENSAQ